MAAGNPKRLPGVADANQRLAALRAVLFDFGNTLFYSPDGAAILVQAGVEPATADQVWTEIWAAAGTPEEMAKGRDLSPENHRRMWMALFSRADVHVPGISERLYETMTPELWTPYPDALPVLRRLHRRGVPVGVVSNVGHSLRPVFDRHGLGRYVSAYVQSYEEVLEKPAPELFRTACRLLQVEPSQTLMVGDSQIADGGAVAAGLEVYLLPQVPRGAPRGLARVLDLLKGSRARGHRLASPLSGR